jgi:hypothetical protein
MMFHLISGRSAHVAVMVVSAAAMWGTAPHAAADPRQTLTVHRKPASAQKPPDTVLGFFRRSAYTTSRRTASTTSRRAEATSLYSRTSPPQVSLAGNQPVIVRPPVFASVAPAPSQSASIDANSAGRSRLVLPVTPGGAPQVPAAASTESISPSPAETSIAPARSEPLTVRKAEPVWPPVPDRPDYGLPVFGRPGFVHPPGLFSDNTIVIDVRGFAPGQKVRDPRNGNVFLVPPL